MGALVGVASGAVALGVVHLVAAPDSRASSPIVAVGSAAIEITHE